MTLDPPLPGILSIYSDGEAYINKLQLGPVDHDDVGVYDVTMKIEQLSQNGDGYFVPERGFLKSVSYSFSVTVNPCVVSSLKKTPSSLQIVKY